jgi:hypothetical protein
VRATLGFKAYWMLLENQLARCSLAVFILFFERKRMGCEGERKILKFVNANASLAMNANA